MKWSIVSMPGVSAPAGAVVVPSGEPGPCAVVPGGGAAAGSAGSAIAEHAPSRRAATTKPWVAENRMRASLSVDRCRFREVGGSAGSICAMSRRYDPVEFEPKWQQVWADERIYEASEDPADERPRFYALDMYPYPSGDLHMGHAEA